MTDDRRQTDRRQPCQRVRNTMSLRTPKVKQNLYCYSKHFPCAFYSALETFVNMRYKNWPSIVLYCSHATHSASCRVMMMLSLDGEDDDNGCVDLRCLLAAYTHHHSGRRRTSSHLDLQVRYSMFRLPRLPCDSKLTLCRTRRAIVAG